MSRRSSNYQKVLKVLETEARMLMLPELQSLFNTLMADAREPFNEWKVGLGRVPGLAEQNEWIAQFLQGRPYAERYTELCDTLNDIPNLEHTVYNKWRQGLEYVE